MYDAAMPTCQRWMTWILLCLLAATAASRAGAQPGADQKADVRYQFGDDARWSATDFDDQAWSVARNAPIPLPPVLSDGFIWMRMRVSIPLIAAEPLALKIDGARIGPDVQEVFVNGVRLAQSGNFPPDSSIRMLPQQLVIDLPSGVVQKGSTAVVAIRGWMTPLRLSSRSMGAMTLTVDDARLQHATAGKAQSLTLLAYMPQFATGLLLEGLGMGVLALGLWSGRRELFLCALWLVTMPVFLTLISLGSLITGVSWRLFETLFIVVNAAGMYVVVEFIWTVQGFRLPLFRRLAHASWILDNIASLVAVYATHGPTVSTAHSLDKGLLLAFNLLTVSADVWAVMGRGRNRAIGAAMALISVGYFMRLAQVPWRSLWLQTDFFGSAFYLSSVVIAALLVQETWAEWKKNDELRIQFAAARELQQQLVPLKLPEVAGLKFEAAYLPAQDVGGDFYQVLVQPNGSTIVLVGDVSGKGLKAGMTGVLTIGAARAIALSAAGPADLLTRLNREVAQGQSGGFVTCVCAWIGADGRVALANAGHLAPYCNGRELPVEAGLPLGVIPDVQYGESRVELKAGDRLTFLSDGVVEAQNHAGELFGFARTEAAAGMGAAEIAALAMQFGQTDDITVLRLEYAPAPAI